MTTPWRKWLVGGTAHLLLCAALVMPTGAQAQQDTTQVDLEAVTVSSAVRGNAQSRSSLLQQELINRAGLTRMACCTLASSFENSATTQTSYSDAITGTRQIQMLGLSGVYTQTMAENVPTLRGLSYAYGWDYTPAAWLDGISIAKGMGTVVNGWEGITGQINLDYRKPNEGRPLYIDFYTDTDLHHEVNVVAKRALSEKLYSALFAHTTQTTMPDRWHRHADANHDGFADMPEVENYNVYNRWLYADVDRGLQSRLDVRMAYDHREAGQTMLAHGHQGMAPAYRVDTRNLNFQASNKTGVAIGHREGQSLGIINSVTLHGLRTKFGMRNLDADQLTYYGNVVLNSYLGNERHKYQVGAGYLYDRVRELFNADNQWMGHEDKVSNGGFFAEYTNTALPHLTVQAGARADYMHHRGWLFTPRVNVKYEPAKWLVARITGGRGYRMAHYFADNIGLMASSRQWQILDHRRTPLEDAWSFGANVIFTMPIWLQQEATLSLDYYQVRFRDRVAYDVDADADAVAVYFSPGSDFTQTWQADLSLPLFRGMTLYGAWRYTMQHLTQRDGQRQYAASGVLVPCYKGLVSAQYATPMRRWVIDATLQLNGRTRLPAKGFSQQGRPLSEHSPAYALLFAQVSKRMKHVEVYVGGENLLSYRQKHPIIGWERPFDDGFDASQVWGPITGRKVYAGVRLDLGQYF